MGRLDGRYVDIVKDTSGAPTGFCLRGERVLIRITEVVEHFREWIGVFTGNRERDIWRVNTALGSCEIHHLYLPAKEDEEPEGYWCLFRWDD